MTSSSNIPKAEVKRLRNDETGEITILFTANGQPLDISARNFVLSFCTENTLTEILAIANTAFVRPPGTNDRIVCLLTPAQRVQLPANNYTGYLYELVTDVAGNAGKREVRGWFSFIWQNQPDGYVDGVPSEPANLQVNFIPASGLSSILAVYLLQGITVLPAASRSAMLGLPDPALIMFVLVANDELWGDTSVLYQCTADGKRVRILTADN